MTCSHRKCQETATHVYAWRSPSMAVSSFWYGCKAHVTEWANKPSNHTVGKVRAL